MTDRDEIDRHRKFKMPADKLEVVASHVLDTDAIPTDMHVAISKLDSKAK
jgi:hypothetical protein